MNSTTSQQRRRYLGMAVASPLLGAPGSAQAQEWPSKPIKLVLPSGAGGGADVFGRPLAQYLGNELKASVVVENRPGANGILAHEAVVKQPADGHTLLISYTAAMIGNKLMQPEMSHDPLADFVPIGRIGGAGGNTLIVNPDLPVKNIKGCDEQVSAPAFWSKTGWIARPDHAGQGGRPVQVAGWARRPFLPNPTVWSKMGGKGLRAICRVTK